jgi:tRNA pseudouridine55 synthase
MARRKGNKIDGWLIVDKPLGVTSTDIIRVIRRAAKPLKIGHGGTLDPLATGILPIGLGEATKAMPFITDASKEYVFEIAFGGETNTGDREGEITQSSDVFPTEDEIIECLKAFRGKIEQLPPVYSAIRIDGKRAYQRARDGEEVVMTPRIVEIHDISLLDMDHSARTARLHVTCGKGTYVRALARDIARNVGARGHVKSLRRTRVGPFCEKHAISLALEDDLSHIARAVERALPVMTALTDISALALTENEAGRAIQGQPLKLATDVEGMVILTLDGAPLAIAQVSEGTAKPKRIFNLSK